MLNIMFYKIKNNQTNYKLFITLPIQHLTIVFVSECIDCVAYTRKCFGI